MIAVLYFFFVFGIKVTTTQSSVVQTCPKTKAAWDHRSSMFTCANNTRYHCVMDSTWTLVEICITSLNISRNIGGCPTVYIFDSKGFWLFPFTPCPIQNNECPQESHGNYTSEQLFKYPACFLNKDEREINGTEFQQSTAETSVSKSDAHREELYRQDVAYIPYAFGTTLILIVIILVLLFLQKRHTQNLFRKAITLEPSRGISEISIVSPTNLKDIKENEFTNHPVPDYGTETRSHNSFGVGGYTSQNNCDIKENKNAHIPVPDYGTKTRISHSFAVGGFTSRQKNCDIKENEYTNLPVPDYGTETRNNNSFEAGESTSQSYCDLDIIENEYTNLPAPDYGTETINNNSFEAGESSSQSNCDIKDNEYANIPVPYYGTETRSSNVFAVSRFTSRLKNGDLGGRDLVIFSVPNFENKSQSSSSSKDDGSENVLIKQGNTIPRKYYTVT